MCVLCVCGVCGVCVLCVLPTFRRTPLFQTPLFRTALRRTAQNFALFYLSRRKFHSFFSLWMVFTLNFCSFCEDRDPKMCTFGLSGCRVKPHPHPSGLHPSGPHPSGPHPSGPTLLVATALGQTEFGQYHIWPKLIGHMPTLCGRIWPIFVVRIWPDRIWPFFCFWWGVRCGVFEGRGGGPNPEKVGPRRVGPRRVGLSLNFGVRSAGALKCARLEFSGCRVRAAAAPFGGAAGVSLDSPRAQTYTFERPGLQKHHQNSTEDTQREKKEWNFRRERETKERNFGRSRRRAVRRRRVRGRGPKILKTPTKLEDTHQTSWRHPPKTQHTHGQNTKNTNSGQMRFGQMRSTFWHTKSGQMRFGQMRSRKWPGQIRIFWPNAVLAKCGLAKCGHDHPSGPHFFWVWPPPWNH